MLSLVLAAALLSVVSALPHGASHPWGYDPTDGPDTWTGTCASGFRQSPVDIRAADVEYSPLKKLHFVNYMKSGPIKVENNGHTVMISGFQEWPEADQPLIFGGALEGRYRLAQIHFHWDAAGFQGSEHTIATLHYPVEAHFVHQKEEIPKLAILPGFGNFAHFVHQKEGTQNLTTLPGDGLAVVGAFFTLSETGNPFSSLESSLRKVKEPKSNIQMQQYNALQLLPANRDNFYTYEGSLTTPHCDETVIWTLLAEPSTITETQLGYLRSLKSLTGKSHERNSRPTQPLNGRRIRYRAPNMERTHCQPQNSATPMASSLFGVLVVALFSVFA